MEIGVCKLINDTLMEFLLHGKYIIKHAETCSNTSGIFCIRRSTACPVSRIAALWIIIKLQSGTGAVIALLNHQIGCNAGINTTAHGNDFFFIHNFSPVNERIGVPVHREQLRINQEYGIIIRN